MKVLTTAFIMVFLFSTLASTTLFGVVYAELSVPEFTVVQVDRSYDVPETVTNSTDPFTGEQITVKSGGYHVENNTIDVTIKNQPFTPFELEDGRVVRLYYSLRTKGHFGNWSDTNSDNGYTFKRVLASTSEYIVITLIVSSPYKSDLRIPDGGQEDFQVKAVAAYFKPYLREDGSPYLIPIAEFVPYEESSWSDTQTLTFETAVIPEFPSWIILPLILVVSLVVVIAKKRLPQSIS